MSFPIGWFLLNLIIIKKFDPIFAYGGGTVNLNHPCSAIARNWQLNSRSFRMRNRLAKPNVPENRDLEAERMKQNVSFGLGKTFCFISLTYPFNSLPILWC